MIFVVIGGFWGAVFRFWISKRLNKKFPFGTLIVNILGSFFLGMLVSNEVRGNGYLLAATGFLGAFTTFSTFLFEASSMQPLKKIFYITFTCASGLLGAWLALQA